MFEEPHFFFRSSAPRIQLLHRPKTAITILQTCLGIYAAGIKTISILLPDKKPKRILRFSYRHYIRYPVKCIDGVQFSQYFSNREAVAVVFCKHACFDEFRHKVFGRDHTDRWVAVKVLFNDGIDLRYYVHVGHVKAS